MSIRYLRLSYCNIQQRLQDDRSGINSSPSGTSPSGPSPSFDRFARLEWGAQKTEQLRYYVMTTLLVHPRPAPTAYRAATFMTGQVLQSRSAIGEHVKQALGRRGDYALVGDRPLEAVLADERVELFGTTGAVRVWHGLGRRTALALYPVEDRGEDLDVARRRVSAIHCCKHAQILRYAPSKRRQAHRHEQSLSGRHGEHRGSELRTPRGSSPR